MTILNTIRGQIQTSLHGRRLGLDKDEQIIVKGVRHGVTYATSDSTGTSLPNSGHVSVITTTDDTWTLTDPVPGCTVRLFTGSTSTGVHTINCAAATIVSSVSSTFGQVVLTGGAAGVELTGISTAVWQLTSRNGTTANSHVSSA